MRPARVGSRFGGERHRRLIDEVDGESKRVNAKDRSSVLTHRIRPLSPLLFLSAPAQGQGFWVTVRSKDKRGEQEVDFERSSHTMDPTRRACPLSAYESRGTPLRRESFEVGRGLDGEKNNIWIEG